jgi:chromosome segregation ATPase
MDIKGVLIAVNDAQNAADKMRHFRHAEFVEKLNALWTALKDFDQGTLEKAASDKTALAFEIDGLQKQKDALSASIAGLDGDFKAQSTAGRTAMQAQADELKARLADEHAKQVAEQQGAIANLQSNVSDLKNQLSALETSKANLENAISGMRNQFRQVSESLN